LGDIFSVRVAGNVTSPKVLGSMEYGCAVAGAKLILVMGHTRCGAVAAAVNLATSTLDAQQATGCQHLGPIVHDIQQSIDAATLAQMQQLTTDQRGALTDVVARRNVQRAVRQIVEQSTTVSGLIAQGRVAVVGAMYDVATGRIDFMTDDVPEPPAAKSPG
jgi:carbonic anhydrase/SulP family sulfate permease